MKRYLLFKYNSYETLGGWKDFAGSFDTIEEAKQNRKSYLWNHNWKQTE